MNANPLLRSLMSGASRLARAARLQEARVVIQSAWRRTFGPKEAPAAPPSPSASPPFEAESEIVDAVFRDAPRDEPSTAHVPPVPPRAEAGRFVSGRHVELAGQRGYKLFIPPNPQGLALPLVVMLHGCQQDPDDFALGTGMNELALAKGFFVLYPAQSTEANGHGCWSWFKYHHQHRDRGEPGLLAGMTRAVMGQHPIDPRRVFVAGLSAGGSMAAILGDAYPDLFAAVGVHSGLPRGAARSVTSALAAMSGNLHPLMGNLAPSLRPRGLSDTTDPAHRRGRAPPTIVFHGDEDKTVHPVNGERVVAACLDAGPDGLVPARREQGQCDNGRSYTRQCHHDASGRTVSEHWIVHGSGHAWSGGRAQGSFTDPQGPDASREMVRFFLANPAPSPH